MIHRFHEQVFQRMPPERRARRFAVMKVLTKSVKDKNKKNENPLNNSMALSYNFTHSTPVKNHQVTDLDDVESDSEARTEPTDSDLYGLEEKDETGWKEQEDREEPKLVISKIYDLNDDRGDSKRVEEEPGEGVTLLGLKKLDDDNGKQYRSLETLPETAEHEFFRSLEESKLFMSTSSLLEEIEAELPSPYSLAKPLSHTFLTLTSYRTQTRLARMDANLTCPDILSQRESMSQNIGTSKVERLEMEATVQKSLAEQTEKALILSKTQKFFGVQHIECEKAFLLANLRYNAAVEEAKKLKILGETYEKENFGQVIISDICFHVSDTTDDVPGKYFCTATEKEHVRSTSVVSKVTDGTLHFNEPLEFSNLSKDFVISIDLFKLHYKEPKRALLTTALVKKFKKMTAVNWNRSLTSSSCSRSGFMCVAQCDLRLEDIVSREDGKCVLQNYLTVNLQHPVAENVVSLIAKTDIHIKSKQIGFLNVFRQTWHRRWFSQSGYFLESWLYPEDQESDKAPLDSIYLPNCRAVEAVGLEVCIRPHSFVIILKETSEEILFSASSQKDMLNWIENLNLTLEQIRLWKPKA